MYPQEIFEVRIILAPLGNDHLSASEDVSHYGHLGISLLEVGLVDAESISP